MKKDEMLLFLKYAVPCAETAVKRKKVPKKTIESIVLQVKEGKVPKEKVEEIFKIAFGVCKAMALKKRKEINEQIIKEYFWFKHDAVVEERSGLMGDFDAEKCKTYPGVVLGVWGERAMVRTSLGEQNCSIAFAPKIKKGSFVVVHRDFVVEEIEKQRCLEIAQKTSKFF